MSALPAFAADEFNMLTGAWNATPAELSRFLSRVVQESGGCWVWQGGVQGRGYGSFSYGGHVGRRKSGHQGSGRTYLVHRWSFEHYAGRPIAKGQTLDHVCGNKRCVNPAHLEEVTRAENTRRAAAAERGLRGRVLLLKFGGGA